MFVARNRDAQVFIAQGLARDILAIGQADTQGLHLNVVLWRGHLQLHSVLVEPADLFLIETGTVKFLVALIAAPQFHALVIVIEGID